MKISTPVAAFVMTTTTIVVMLLAAGGAECFSEPATRGSYCDHDKVKKTYLDAKYTVAHSRDSSSSPLNIAYHPVFVPCTASQLATDASRCSKCNAIGDSMPTFVAKQSISASVATPTAEIAVCNTSDMLTLQKELYILDLVTKATAEIGALLNSPHLLGGLKPSPTVGQKCGDYPGLRLPDAHATPLAGGEHLMLYLSAGPDSATLRHSRNRTSVSGAAHPPPLVRGAACGYTSSDERPITGHLHFTPAAITAAWDPATEYSDTKKKKDMMFVVHQILHILGYSEPFFRQGHGSAYLGSRQTYNGGALTSSYAPWTGGESRRLMSTANVRNKVRDFFGCTVLTGAESYEQQGDSHWAKRLFVDDVMAEPLPWDTGVPVISDVTLAFFHDTTFWMPSYGQRNQSLHGWKRGCDFARSDCRNRRSFGANKNVDWEGEYCWDRRHAQCTANLRAGGPCNLVDYSAKVPSSSLQYFAAGDSAITDMTKTGGTVVEDFCGMAVQDGGVGDDIAVSDLVSGGTTSGDEATTEAPSSYAARYDKESTVHDASAFFSQCDDLSNWKSAVATKVMGNVYGDETTDSRCYVGTVNKMGATPRSPYREARCTMMRCAKDSASNTVVFLELFNGSITIKCPVLGGTVNIGLYSTDFAGDIMCPPATLCNEKSGRLLRTLNAVLTESTPVVDSTVLSGTAVCSARLVCANKARDTFSGDLLCGGLSREVTNCFAGRCPSEQSTFFRELGLGKNCTAAEFEKMSTKTCADGISGAADLCGLVQSAGVGALSTGLVLVLLMVVVVCSMIL